MTFTPHGYRGCRSGYRRAGGPSSVCLVAPFVAPHHSSLVPALVGGYSRLARSCVVSLDQPGVLKREN
jgi:predicted ATPase with chaperone activity